MPFRFALAPLLRFRQSIERQRMLRLREASLNAARARDAVTRLDDFLASSTEADQSQLRAGRSAAELHFAVITRDNLDQVRQRLEGELAQLEQVRQEAASEYQQAYRERELLETLRERAHDEYVQEQNRRQQRVLDAAHVIQRWHNPKG